MKTFKLSYDAFANAYMTDDNRPVICPPEAIRISGVEWKENCFPENITVNVSDKKFDNAILIKVAHNPGATWTYTWFCNQFWLPVYETAGQLVFELFKTKDNVVTFWIQITLL